MQLACKGAIFGVSTPLLLGDGSMVAPSYSFAGDTDTGFYSPGSDYIYLTSGGSYAAAFTNWKTTVSTVLKLGSAEDCILNRDAANILALANGNNDQHYRIYGANGTYRDQGTISELLTIAAAATSTTTMTIPANAVVYAVSVRVTVVIPTAATFTVIGNTSTTVFNTTAVSTAVDSTDVGTALCPYTNGAAQTIRITPNATPADNSGRVRITIHYYFINPATS